MKENNNQCDILEIRDYYPSINNPTSSTWVYNQAISLQELGFKPFIISPTPINPLIGIFKKKYQLYDIPSKKIENYKNTTVIRPPFFKVPNNKMVGMTLNNLSKCILKHGNINSIKLIHAHFGQNGYASLALKKKLDVPLITSFYGYDSGRLGKVFKPYYKYLAREGELFLALSMDMKRDLINLGFPEEKIIIHHLGINLNEFKYSELIQNKKFKILTVARLDEVKGVQFVIKAIKIFIDKYPQERIKLTYTVLGGGIFEKNLKELVYKLGLEDIVDFKNNLISTSARKMVKEEMMNCNLFCLCSFVAPNGGKEGTPVVLMEAQACGRPCIATFHAGIPEVVVDRETGILVNEGSEYEIADAIEKYYFSIERLKNDGLNARKHIENNFNQDKQMDILVKIFKSISTL